MSRLYGNRQVKASISKNSLLMPATTLRSIYLFWVSGLIVTVCNVCQSTNTPRLVTDTDYEVYSAFLNTFEFYRNVPSKETILILDSTSINSGDINPRTPWSWVTTHLGNRYRYNKDEIRCRKARDPDWAPLFDALQQPINQRPAPLQQRLKTRYPVRVLSRLQLHEWSAMEDDHRPAYYIFNLSNIMYDNDQTKALFFSGFVCGGTCGRGELVMLEKIGQTWTVIDTFRFWIA